MIYTITLNPAIDRTFWIQRIRDDVSNRILEEKSFAGGKSIDVSRVLKNLGIDNTALGFVGGFAGRDERLARGKTSSGIGHFRGTSGAVEGGGAGCGDGCHAGRRA